MASGEELIDHYNELKVQSTAKPHQPWEQQADPFSTEFNQRITIIIPTIGLIGEFMCAQRLTGWCLPLKNDNKVNNDIIC